MKREHVFLITVGMLCLTFVWWNATRPPVIKQDLPKIDTIPTTHYVKWQHSPDDSVAWEVFEVRMKNGDIWEIDGTHYVQSEDGAMYQIKDGNINHAVWTGRTDEVESIVRTGHQ